ncbi:TIGR04222 domain-containing membrane protein [Allokutzneria albata]|uniref:TIGR04222 domain-containing protein n=1 Tax=Allokutzneria albata TaxID=211114 RepID=A0A1G9XY16_ALLAB|nr:TIGR04222 domain-containing membrane protein [Allokutzneria albata]SDN01667.1 TIGR04222 domain-containing protein [Allokutzneria albata]
MTEPWGISGPAFLGLYSALIIGVLLANSAWARSQRRAGERQAPASALITPPYHLAFLVGGARRAAETALATLLADGRLRIASSGLVSRTSGGSTSDPLENAVLDKANTVRARTVVERVMGSAACDAIADDLADRGLVVPAAAARSRLRRISLLFLVVCVVGVLRLVDGVSAARPVGFLIPLVMIAGIAALVARKASARARAGTRTVLGDRVVAEARNRHDHHADEPDLVGVSTFGFAAGAVLFGGLALYPDAQIQDALTYTPPPVPGTGGAESGGGDGGGSSCGGGGGCGGGGCGGCGG